MATETRHVTALDSNAVQALATYAREDARNVVSVKRIGLTDYILTMNSGRKAYAVAPASWL